MLKYILSYPGRASQSAASLFLDLLTSKKNMEVEIISGEFIKPSCPTPKHLKNHKISLLDQFIPPSYIPMVLFYKAEQSPHAVTDIASQRLQLLKQSLSEVLTHFHPFAGRIRDKLSIDCNDEGVYYTEAKVHFSLFEFFNQPNLSLFINKFIPSYKRWDEAVEGAQVAMIQVTCFACGGIAIGLSLSHMIGDGAAVSLFFNHWGATARGAVHSSLPDFNALPAIFPQNKACPKDANMMALCGMFLKKGRRVMRRFLFGAAAISELKAQGSSLKVQNPTRVEAVSSFICKCAVAAFKAKSGLERPILATYVVNMRQRAVPAFSESYMGNFLWMANALMSAEENVIELSDMVVKLREAMTTINSDFVKSLGGEGGFIRYSESLQEMVEAASSAAIHGVDYVAYTSCCRFGFYDTDYGWGKPAWVTYSGSTDADIVFLNTVILMDTPTGDGIEALIYLHEDDMTILQENKKLLAFATLDPNPLVQWRNHVDGRPPKLSKL